MKIRYYNAGMNVAKYDSIWGVYPHKPNNSKKT